MPAMRPETALYKPAPADTSHLELSPDLVDLTEQLAENAHDVWAAQRIADGWVYGPRRDDTRKTHPNLVPYADLSETEKNYDRQTAMGAIRQIITLGYQLKKP